MNNDKFITFRIDDPIAGKVVRAYPRSSISSIERIDETKPLCLIRLKKGEDLKYFITEEDYLTVLSRLNGA